ncbi:prorelaxin H2 [Xenopus laevis]|uniref:Prorelaxin H2 n=2 Tax=Xenopus laevis TaxID=8355 RepID=A0A1L8HY61_XENLA|nr:prorelaxin H2 [Xenopus laevis]OCU01044.1 hypothetical protein XELAEV_18006826mg [Xenopus laevis]
MAHLRGAAICAMLLLVSHLLGEMSAQRNTGASGEYGVKLCGREFIRAVIFTCGGSRWKRLSVAKEESGETRRDVPPHWSRGADPMQDSSNEEMNQLKLLKSLSGSQVEQLQNGDLPLQALKDSLNAYGDYHDYLPMTDDFSEYVRQMEEATRKAHGASQIQARSESDGYAWMKVPRRRREMNIGVAGICCKWGCTKAEISTLC